MNKIDLSVPTRQSAKGLVIIFLQSIRQAIRMFWALIAVVFLQRNVFAHKTIIPIAIGVILLLLIIHTILYYLNFYFYVKDGEFILKKGYLRKKVLTIPIERIQSINTKQNILQQALGVVALEIDTAGTAGKELKIHALELPFATALSELLENKKQGENIATEENSEQTRASSEQLILKLEPVDLLKIGLSQNHLQAGLIIIAFGSQLFNQVQDIFEKQADEYSSEFVNYVSGSSFALIIFLIIFFLIISVLFSLFKTVLKYFDFKLLKNEEAYRVEAGLINKRNVVLPHSKIQQLNWETGPLKKLFGIFLLSFKQAVSKQNRKQQLVEAPGCLNQHLEQLKTDLFGEEKLSQSTKFRTDNFYFWPLWSFMGLFPVIVASPFLYSQWIFWAASFLWFLVSAGYIYLIVRKRYFRINNEQIRISEGAISHKWKQMELFKIQSVKFKQNIFQKRRSLASLELMNASGSITIPYINEVLAKSIYNYLLYHTQTSTKKWM